MTRETNAASSLPGKGLRMSVPEFQAHMARVSEEAKSLCERANRIYRRKHKDDDIKTDIFEDKDFIKNNEVFIPSDAQELFDEAEHAMGNRVEASTTEEPNVAEPSAEELMEQMGAKRETVEVPTADKPETVIRHPILEKIKASFGLEQDRPLVVEKKIGDVVWGFETPTTMTTHFALAIAADEAIGPMDLSHNINVARIAMSIVSIDGIPTCTVYGLPFNGNPQDAPLKYRKLAAVQLYKMLNATFKDNQFEMFSSFYLDTFGSAEQDLMDTDGFVEMRCPQCGKTKIVTLPVSGKLPERFCEFDGFALLPTNTTETDENAPLA